MTPGNFFISYQFSTYVFCSINTEQIALMEKTMISLNLMQNSSFLTICLQSYAVIFVLPENLSQHLYVQSFLKFLGLGIPTCFMAFFWLYCDCIISLDLELIEGSQLIWHLVSKSLLPWAFPGTKKAPNTYL